MTSALEQPAIIHTVNQVSLPPYRLASRLTHPEDTTITIGDVLIGGGDIVLIAGPCAVEDEEQLLSTAWAAKRAGAAILRGGAFKPRTSPYDFQGLGEHGLEILAKAREQTGLLIITEVMSETELEQVAKYADILQVGSRSMSHFRLLEAIAKTGKPVLLKRGFQATIREWLLSAEYLIALGNPNVILCERGIRTFDSEHTRNTLDISAVPVLKDQTHLPVIVDPSHGTGRRDLVTPMSKAAIAAGADGLMVEIHPNPSKALCDGKQSLTLDEFDALVHVLKPLATACGKRLAVGSRLLGSGQM